MDEKIVSIVIYTPEGGQKEFKLALNGVAEISARVVGFTIEVRIVNQDNTVLTYIGPTISVIMSSVTGKKP